MTIILIIHSANDELVNFTERCTFTKNLGFTKLENDLESYTVKQPADECRLIKFIWKGDCGNGSNVNGTRQLSL